MSICTATGRAFAIAALLIAPLAALAGESGHAPLRPVSDCMDPGRVRAWSLDGDDRVLVDAGRRHYVIDMARGCPELGIHPFLGFISHNPSGRICGDSGDRLVPHGAAAGGRQQCPIARIRVVDRDEYAALQARRDGNS